jgi:hypothetical protein
MIKNFADKETEKVYNQKFSKKAASNYSTNSVTETDYD